MKIVDCFIFYNETELLNVRLHELYDVVYYFILVEGTKTFTGNDKKLYYNENKDMFSKYNNKIIHIIVEDYPKTNNSWDREIHQINCISRGIKQISLNNEDIIMITDVDEIPSYDFVNSIKYKNIIQNNSVYSIGMKLYYYTLEWTSPKKWYHPKALNYLTYLKIQNPENIRHDRHNYKKFKINNTGWHISYYGDAHFIINKLESFSEQQDNTAKNKDISYLNQCISNGTLHFNNEKLVYIPITMNKELPSFFKQ